ncbi:MAG: FtsW/RodA/SpoVE family cell cycle protein [Clostridiales bacterium]|jgi:cell division protein FtsW (lipid II flippase)|nr:FtsW/RodA/SpoVE family cell cycle protein [Clostridiales bacterium]
MVELLIIASRYIFLVLISVFLLQSVVILLAQNRKINPHAAKAASVSQRVVIFMVHILAFSILSLGDAHPTVKTAALQVGAAFFIFFILALILIKIFYKNACPLIINCLFLLMDLGIIIITRVVPDLALRQLIFMAAGFMLILFIPVILKVIPKTDSLSLLYLIVGGVLLASPFLFGVTKGGATNWVAFNIASSEISFQPSEAVKFIFVFYLASVFRKERKLSGLIAPIAVSMLFILILVYQRDLGASLIYFLTFIAMLYIAENKPLLVLSAFAAFSAACVIAYKMFAHIRERVEAWLNPFADVADTGYQIAQSLFAAGTWGPLGSGLTRGLPGYIPAVESDFVFSAICEEFGVIFGLALIGVYIVIFIRGMEISLVAESKYHKMLAAGFAAMLCFQTFLIIAGNMRFLPLTGVTLPFISYGGSSIVVSLSMAGVIIWTAGIDTDAAGE